MRLYLGFYVYDDSCSPELGRCGHCGMQILDRMGIHATTDCGAGCRNAPATPRWGRVAIHDRLATIFFRCLASPDGLALKFKYFQDEAKRLLFGKISRPADALIFPPLQAPGAAFELPTAMDFKKVSGAGAI